MVTSGMLITLAFLLAAQDQPRIPSGIAIAFRTGSAAGLSEYLNSTVELVLPGKEDFYSKSVATKPKAIILAVPWSLRTPAVFYTSLKSQRQVDAMY